MVRLHSCFFALVLSLACSGVAHAQPASHTEVATLEILGVIDQETALTTLTAASTLPRRLDVTIDSPGGGTPSADIIVRTFTSLRSTGTVVKCRVTGKALSAAFWILQACSIREAVPGARLMIHEPRAMFPSGEVGTALVASIPFLKSLVKGLEDDSNAIANTCATRMQIAIPDWHTKLAVGDWNMTPKQALSFHALDSITS